MQLWSNKIRPRFGLITFSYHIFQHKTFSAGCMVCTILVFGTHFHRMKMWNIATLQVFKFYIHHTYLVQLRIALLGSPRQLAVSSVVLWPMELLPLSWDVFSWVWTPRDEAEDLHACKQKQQQGLYSCYNALPHAVIAICKLMMLNTMNTSISFDLFNWYLSLP